MPILVSFWLLIQGHGRADQALQLPHDPSAGDVDTFRFFLESLDEQNVLVGELGSVHDHDKLCVLVDSVLARLISGRLDKLYVLVG